MKSLFALIAVTATLAFGVGCCALSAPRYEGPATSHFDGNIFRNIPAIDEHGFSDFLKWRMEREPADWPEVQGAAFGPPPPASVGGGKVRVTFVNHATVLIQQDELNILTDPIWSERSSPFSFVGPKRIRPPGIRFEDLPQIDAVLISHSHYDHLDLPTLERLAERHPNAEFFVGLGNAVLLRKAGIRRVREMDWGDRADCKHLAITAVQNQHFSGRGLCDRDRTLWTAWAVIGPSGTTYFAGDTGYGPHFKNAARRLGPIRLAILPIGAYAPRWFMQPIHVDPAEAVRAAHDLGAATSVGIHFGTFPLADEGPDDPPRELQKALEADPHPPRFWVLGFGEGRDVPAL